MEIEFDMPVDIELLPARVHVMSVKCVEAAINPAETQQMPAWLARLKQGCEFSANKQVSALEQSIKAALREGELTNRQALKQVSDLLGEGY